MRTFFNIDRRIDKSLVSKACEPVVIYVQSFDEKGMDSFQKSMNDAHKTGQPVIPIVVDSFGGSAYGCLGMVSAIQNARLPVATICASKAMSAGAILFSFGTDGYRFMDPNAVMMIHDVASFTGGKVEDMKVSVNNLDKLNQSIYKRMALHLGLTENYILDIIKKQQNHTDWYLTAKEAKKHKIANHLKIPSFEVNCDVQITFNS